MLRMLGLLCERVIRRRPKVCVCLHVTVLRVNLLRLRSALSSVRPRLGLVYYPHASIAAPSICMFTDFGFHWLGSSLFWCFASCTDASQSATRSASRRPFPCHIHAACIPLCPVSCVWARMTRSDDLTGASIVLAAGLYGRRI